MKFFFKAAFLTAAAVLTAIACTKVTPQEPADGGSVELVPDKPEYKNAKFVYGGGMDGGSTDIWTIVLYTDMELAGTGNPVAGTGPGDVIRIVVNTEANPSSEPELSFVAGDYSAPVSSGDFSAGTFQTGYMVTVDSPVGEAEIPEGSYYAEFADGSSDFEPDFLREGGFDVLLNDDGTVTVDGVLVGDKFLKRYFSWTGTPEVSDGQNAGSVTWPNSNLTSDLDLPDFTKARLIDREDIYTLDQRARSFVLYLAEDGVDISSEWPSGTGKVLRLEMFVSWETDVNEGIPAGTYTAIPASSMYENGGIVGSNIKPGVLVSGKPDTFEHFAGSWYLELENGSWKNYARIDGGDIAVERNGDAHSIEIRLSDCASPANAISGLWESDDPIAL